MSSAFHNKEFDFLVFIGRFQPFHLGHKSVIDEALERANRVIVLVGSARGPRTLRNPFTYNERADMIRLSYQLEDRDRLFVTPLVDRTYQDSSWIESVQYSVNSIAVQYKTSEKQNIGLIGRKKDHTSFYLDMFPQWGSVPATIEPMYADLNATDIRECFFKNYIHHSCHWPIHVWDKKLIKCLPHSTESFMEQFNHNLAMEGLNKEREFIQKANEGRKRLDGYPVIDQTVDTAVFQSGHILLVKRKAQPGKGLWALPGGYINENERLQDAAIRELKEETNIFLDEKILSRNIKRREVFDDPNRSSRGRIITTAFLIELEGKKNLPKVSGADDALKAKWWPLSDITPEMMFEDHFHMINVLRGYVK